MIRRLVAGLIVVGLAVGVWFLWPRDDSVPTPTTLPTAVDSTTTTSTLPPTTTSTPATTASLDSHVVTTVEEAEVILRELWFGWFEGIYNQDQERIKEVVGTKAFLEAGRTAMDTMAFNSFPSPDAIAFEEIEILRSDGECLAIWLLARAPFVETTADANQSVDVLRWTGDRWVLVSTWRFRDDLWEADCGASLEPLP